MSANLNLEAQDGKLEASSQHKREHKRLPTRIDQGDVPKTQFFQVYNCWRAARCITIHNTKSRIGESNLANYLKALREYLRENLGRRWGGLRNYLEFDIAIIICNNKGNSCALHSSVEILEKWDDFDTAFYSIATEIMDTYEETEEDNDFITGDIDHCVLQDYTPRTML